MKVVFKNDRITTKMEVHLMTEEQIIKTFGNREVELLDENGDTKDIVYFHSIEK